MALLAGHRRTADTAKRAVVIEILHPLGTRRHGDEWSRHRRDASSCCVLFQSIALARSFHQCGGRSRDGDSAGSDRTWCRNLADRGWGNHAAPGFAESVVSRTFCGGGPCGIDATGSGMACGGPFGSHYGDVL